MTPLSALSINPADGRVVAEHSLLGSTEIDLVLEAAVSGSGIWRNESVGNRAERLAMLGSVLREGADELASTITREMGKPITQARGEVEKCAALCDWYAANGPALLADEHLDVGADGDARVVWQPLGIVLGVMPWNFPVWQALRAAVPIMLAGNGFVLKHADNVLGCARLIHESFLKASFPTGAFTNLPVHQDAIESLIADSRIAAVTVTAGTEAGAAVAGAAGRNLKKVVLELGGSDAFIVLGDADLDRAVEAAVRSRFLNAGQVCIAAKRLIVEVSVADQFIRQFVEATRALVVGDPMDEATFVGPLARSRGRDELDAQVRATIADGATLLAGSGAIAGPGNFYSPTVLADVRSGSVAACRELFGPVASIMLAADADHALAIANDSDYGLSSALWSGDPVRADAIARRIEAGAVFVNGISASDPRVPIGGIKRSGFGRELSYFGLREFANAKLIWAR